jgi:Kdo2-lipid IVA lauroyltransferase/acyltransferase
MASHPQRKQLQVFPPVAEFIVGNPLRKLARDHQWLRQLLWRVDFGIIWLLGQLCRLLPVDTASRLGNAVGCWIGPMMKNKSAIYRANMAIAFPALSGAELDRLVRQAWGRPGRILAEYPHLATLLAEPDRLIIDIREPIETYRNPAIPCVIVTAHQSNWEVVCSAMAKLGIPNASLYSPPTNPLLDRMLLESRRALNCELLPRENSTRLLMRALKNGQTAAMVMDRRVDDGKPIRFFGRDKPSTIMPAKLALKFKCDLVPVQVERLQDAHYRVTFHAPVRPRDLSASETDQAIDMIQQVHYQFEDWIRQHPEDWFCSKRLWPKGDVPPTQESGRDADTDSYAV